MWGANNNNTITVIIIILLVLIILIIIIITLILIIMFMFTPKCPLTFQMSQGLGRFGSIREPARKKGPHKFRLAARRAASA